MDLSGSLQGVGGVGGLLAVVKNDNVYIPTYDAIGNIMAYSDIFGLVVAQYGFDSFGNIVTQAGQMADTFSYRFSTKPWDAEARLILYELRPNSPAMGRWISRDLIEEEGGVNVYGFCKNNPVLLIDLLGKKEHWGGEIVKEEKLLFGRRSKTKPINFREPTINCERCPDLACQRAVIGQDAYVEFEVYYTSKFWKTHEYTHVDDFRKAMKKIDFALHELADKKCVNEKCCSAKINVMEWVNIEAHAEKTYLEAKLDNKDYPLIDFGRPTDAQVNKKLIDWNETQKGLDESRRNMEKECAKQ